jgi:hypothetical protein
MSRRRALKAEYQSEQRRLASTVRARDCNELAPVDREVDVPQHGWTVAVGEGHAVEANG